MPSQARCSFSPSFLPSFHSPFCFSVFLPSFLHSFTPLFFFSPRFSSIRSLSLLFLILLPSITCPFFLSFLFHSFSSSFSHLHSINSSRQSSFNLSLLSSISPFIFSLSLLSHVFHAHFLLLFTKFCFPFSLRCFLIHFSYIREKFDSKKIIIKTMKGRNGERVMSMD